MRLCLDEDYAPKIAAGLRRRGHDVIAVQAEPALRGLTDEELLAFCSRERRALVTENAADFVPLVHLRAASGLDHDGLVFSSPSSMPRSTTTIGSFVDALDRLLEAGPAEPALRNRVIWLQPPLRR